MSGIARSATGTLEGYEVFIKYLPGHTTEKELGEYFTEAGPMVGLPRLMKTPTGACKGVGWITFETVAAMDEAVRWNGCNYGGRHLQITRAKQIHSGFRPTLQEAGTHTPALLKETVAALVAPNRDGTLIDATYGRGGHSRGMLQALSPKGALHVFDMDTEAIDSARQLAESDGRVRPHHAPFSSMAERLLHENRTAELRRRYDAKLQLINSGQRSTWELLKADIDADAWSTLYRTESRPFPVPSTGKIAVKVINDYGDEVLKVFDVSGDTTASHA